VAYDWDLAARELFVNARERRLVVAGGLAPGNVGESIAALRPWGVDVVSGVEVEPGKKEPLKVREFVRRARAAEAGLLAASDQEV
jgi:phosphoribosylanthranilate isomerase